MDKLQIASALDEMADFLELTEDNPFRARSFRSGARILETLQEDLGKLVESGRLKEIKGIGPALEEIIVQFVREGASRRYEELKAKVPPGLLQMIRISGLGPKRVRVLHKALGLADLEALEKACKEGAVAGVTGFGEKLQAKILAGIATLQSAAGLFLSIEGLEAALPLLRNIRSDPAVIRADLAGSLRRRNEIVRDIDIVASSASARQVIDRFVEASGAAEVIARGDTKASVRLGGGIQADLRVVDDAAYPFALLYFTGSKEHNTALRGRAKERGFKLNEYGLFRVAAEGDGSDGLSCGDEAAVFRALGLDWIPPELREDRGEIALAEAGALPVLVEAKDLQGVVHVHTTASDGHNTLPELVGAAQGLGYSYLAISDHSQSAGYAGGLKEDRIREQHWEVDQLNKRLRDFRIFKGIESDIRTDGSLDYPPEILDLFDFVIASVHSSFQLSEEEQTARILRAMSDPHCTILGHPTGRLLRARDGYRIDLEKVLRAAGDLGVIVETNANPHRLDLDWRWGALAREAGVKTCISPDAHALGDMGYMDLGVGTARKAGFSAADVVNTYPAEAFWKAIRIRRK